MGEKDNQEQGKEKKFNQREYEKDWRKKNYKSINLQLPIDTYNNIKEHAATQGEKTQTFIKRAINQTIESDNKKEVKKI